MSRILNRNLYGIKLNLFKVPLFSKLSGSFRSVSFLSGSNASYIEDLYEIWIKDKNSVHKSWDLFFNASDRGIHPNDYYQAPPTSAFSNSANIGVSSSLTLQSRQPLVGSFNENLGVYNLIRSYQEYGHQIAKINPLNIDPMYHEKLSLAYWGLNESNLSSKYILPNITFIGGQKTELTLAEIISSLSNVYTSSIGAEYSHLDNQERVNWIKERLEHPQSEILSSEDKVRILERIVKSTLFEAFLAKKYPAEKRFGLEGCDTLIPLLKEIIENSAGVGVNSFIMGMAHRGRLNVLANVCEQPLKHILCRFRDEIQIDDQCSSDVKYHLGLCRSYKNRKTQKEIEVTLVANPSHLEAVNPVAKGKTKARQYLEGDKDGSKIMCILIHGDAAFSGQGIVYETIQMSELPNYTVHGSIHIVTNNQIGFTTDPEYSRSSRYCTDIGKVVNAPIFHVNADDPEAVCRVSRIASEYRNRFKKDVVIDLVGYRRNGHNEGDNPGFTQPVMYKKITSMANVLDLYSRKLIESKIIDEGIYKECVNSYDKVLDSAFSEAQNSTMVENKAWIDSPWKGFFSKEKSDTSKPTGVPIALVNRFISSTCHVPESFNLHPGLKRILSQRLELLEQGKIDWAMGEIAAFSTLLNSGVHIRLSGQDVERGTFSHRHHVLHDAKIDRVTYVPLNHIDANQAQYVVCNSSLSEYGVLGFEHGYSMESPHTLTIWEGQFGDFANTAQCVIDQFISSGEDKWIRQCGLVMLLPHGFDGMGPEHSSARLERFLQLTKEDPDVFPLYSPDNFEMEQIRACNYIVANPTTPANLFHILRRQISFRFRKPLVIMSPKNLLRHEMARSSLSELDDGTFFRRIIPEDGEASQNPSSVKRIIFCSGKVYYELYKTRADKNLNREVAICRIEQISPFPLDMVSSEIAKYTNADIMYVQEEPKNQGAYYHIKPLILLCCRGSQTLKYCGRNVSASPATGSKFQHNIEQATVLTKSFKL